MGFRVEVDVDGAAPQLEHITTADILPDAYHSLVDLEAGRQRDRMDHRSGGIRMAGVKMCPGEVHEAGSGDPVLHAFRRRVEPHDGNACCAGLDRLGLLVRPFQSSDVCSPERLLRPRRGQKQCEQKGCR